MLLKNYLNVTLSSLLIFLHGAQTIDTSLSLATLNLTYMQGAQHEYYRMPIEFWESGGTSPGFSNITRLC